MRFAAIGLDHRHIYDLTEGLLEAGATCAGYWPQTTDPRVLEGVAKRFPHVPAIEERDALMRDPTGGSRPASLQSRNPSGMVLRPEARGWHLGRHRLPSDRGVPVLHGVGN